MSYVTLEEAKDQVAVEQDNTDHDTRLTRLIAAAELRAAQFLNADLADYEDSPANSPPTIPEDIKSAILLFIEWEFDRDERIGPQLLEQAQALLWPHRTGLEV